jgi:hypothetical protein
MSARFLPAPGDRVNWEASGIEGSRQSFFSRMLRPLFALAALFFAADASARTPTFVAHDASRLYDFRISMKNECPGDAPLESECMGPGELAVFEKGSRKALQRIELESIWVVFDREGKPLVNATRLYETQGTIDVGDFNFDGLEDFAVQADQSGPYGGPTFEVFLATPGGKFARSPELSLLTHGTMGLFTVDVARRRLLTMTKSGCCYHLWEEFEMVENRPIAVFKLTEEVTPDGRFVVETRETLAGGKWHRKVHRRPFER